MSQLIHQKAPLGADELAKKLHIHFDHGLGDCTHFAHVLQLYKRRGWDIAVQYESNKAELWQAAGIPYCPRGSAVYHHFRYYSQFNLPRPECEWASNKTGANLNTECLPKIGEPADLWDELCAVDLSGTMEPLLTQEVTDAAKQFLDILPRPIILLHTVGSNIQAAKNIPDGTVHELYRRLLHETDASLVLLGWDNPMPAPPHARIRHVKRDWGHLTLLQLAALMSQASLLIGIDSGPYHFAAMNRVPALGIFHHHYPSCITLPHPKNVNMTRNATSYRPVNFARRRRWNIVEYAGEYPSTEDIYRNAKRMLDGPRYGLPLSRDVQLQQWVRDWMRGSNKCSSLSDRAPTMDYLLQEISRRFEHPTIVETGCIRSHEDWGGAGNSTYLFAVYVASRGGQFVSVDNNRYNTEFAKKTCEGWLQLQIEVADSLEWLGRTKEPIDVLYLDSMDTESLGHKEHGLAEVQAAIPRLHTRSLVVYDDTYYSAGWLGKGALGVPWLLTNGWEILSMGYQVVLGKSL